MPRKKHDNRPLRAIAGEKRMIAAMEHISEARTEILNAQRDLCSIVGLAPESNDLRRAITMLDDVYRSIDAHVNAVQMNAHERNAGELDRDPEPADLRNPHARGCGYPMWRAR